MSSAAKAPATTKFEQLFSRALELRDSGNHSEAVHLFERLREMKPHSASVHAILGEILREEGKVEEAVPLFRKAVELSPQSELASLGLFHSLWESGQKRDAVGEMCRFLRKSDSADYAAIARELVRAELSENEQELHARNSDAVLYLRIMKHQAEHGRAAKARAVPRSMKEKLREKMAKVVYHRKLKDSHERSQRAVVNRVKSVGNRSLRLPKGGG
jgi:predicted Zn-dependent protease